MTGVQSLRCNNCCRVVVQTLHTSPPPLPSSGFFLLISSPFRVCKSISTVTPFSHLEHLSPSPVSHASCGLQKRGRYIVRFSCLLTRCGRRPLLAEHLPRAFFAWPCATYHFSGGTRTDMAASCINATQSSAAGKKTITTKPQISLCWMCWQEKRALQSSW